MASSPIVNRTWLAILLVLSAAATAEGSRYNGGNSDRGRRLPARTNHPAARRQNENGFSPNFDMYDDDFHTTNHSESMSFYKRNNLKPPPLISHGRRTQNKNDTSTNAASDDLNIIIEESKSGTDPSTLLRKHLLSNYDRFAYPWEYAWFAQSEGNYTGVPVEFSINFHRVFSVDIINSVLDLVVWMRIEWVDPRLTWRPEEYGNLTKTWFWIHEGSAGGETSEIWTPDIELWNLEEGISESMDDSYAVVNNDGTIFWSRPGHLRPACKFSGLHYFPFDKLTCTLEFGSWTYSGKYIRMVKGVGGGFTLGGSETSGESFNEFSFVEEDPVTCVEHVYPPYPISPEEDWPVLLYNITIERAWQPYARGYVLLQVLLNVVGFSAFWLPPPCGERMSLSITALLAAVAAEIVVAGKFPAAKEFTWFQKFSVLSMAFAFISLFESVAVLYFYYKRSEDMVPWWFTKFREWYVIRQARKHANSVRRSSADLLQGAGDSMHKKMDEFREGIRKKQSDIQDEDEVPGPTYDGKDSFAENDKKVEEKGEEKRDIIDDDTSNDAAGKQGSASNCDEDSLELDNLDFGVIQTGLKESMISNLSFDDSDRKNNPGIQRQGVRRGQEKTPPKKKVNFSGVSEEKLSLAAQPSRRAMMQQLHQQSGLTESMRTMMVPRDADDFENEEEIVHNKRWKHTAARIDDVARFWIPLTFFIALAIVISQAYT